MGQEAIADTAVQLPDVPCKRVRVNNVGSTESAFIGPDNSVTASNGYQLNAVDGAGGEVTLFVDNVSQVWAISTVTGTTLAFVAQR